LRPELKRYPPEEILAKLQAVMGARQGLFFSHFRNNYFGISSGLDGE